MCTFGNQCVHVCEVSYTYCTRVFKILRETCKRLAVGVGCGLQTCNSVLKVLVIGLILGQSLMVIYIYHGYPFIIMQKCLTFIMYYGSVMLLFTRKLHCLQT